MTTRKKIPIVNICKVCGKEFTAPRKDKPTCPDPECVETWHIMYMNNYTKEKWRIKCIAKDKERVAHGLDNKLKYAAEHGTNYADMQKAETLKMYGRVEV